MARNHLSANSNEKSQVPRVIGGWTVPSRERRERIFNSFASNVAYIASNGASDRQVALMLAGWTVDPRPSFQTRISTSLVMFSPLNRLRRWRAGAGPGPTSVEQRRD